METLAPNSQRAADIRDELIRCSALSSRRISVEDALIRANMWDEEMPPYIQKSNMQDVFRDWRRSNPKMPSMAEIVQMVNIRRSQSESKVNDKSGEPENKAWDWDEFRVYCRWQKARERPLNEREQKCLDFAPEPTPNEIFHFRKMCRKKAEQSKEHGNFEAAEQLLEMSKVYPPESWRAWL